MIHTHRFLRLTGRLRVPPPLTLVQTSGAVRPSNGSASVAARIAGDVLHIWPLYNVASPTEAEWASVYHGLLVAYANKATGVGLENSSHHVVMSLLVGPPHNPRPYVPYYTRKIIDVAETMDWCGLRWIPREENKARSTV
jgi:hypothetical protein